ncbi:MAG TPA: hypothetical protein PKN95_11305 [Verrucomicrobiota bacterium]|nr:hypothetical protein [Verrucomicrobiota bacterium]HNT14589.1 hypothetical protein [Verrucomicrobiota bacterium]
MKIRYQRNRRRRTVSGESILRTVILVLLAVLLVKLLWLSTFQLMLHLVLLGLVAGAVSLLLRELRQLFP